MVSFALFATATHALTLHVTDDADIIRINPNVNNQAGNKCEADNNKKCFMDFNFSILPDGTTSVAQAVLVLFVRQVTREGTIRIAPVDEDWDENTITYNNAPTIFTDHDATRFLEIATNDKGSFVFIDITELVETRLNFPDSNFGLVIEQGFENVIDQRKVDVKFDTKENRLSSHPAEIEVIMN